jgi:hypothetical protein
MKMAGFAYDTKSWQPWVLAVLALVGGCYLARLAWTRIGAGWNAAEAIAREKGLVV